MDKKNKYNIYLSLSIILLMLVFTISSFAYSYFTANVTANSELNIFTTVSNSYTPVFTSSITGTLELDVTSADMLMGDASSENTTVADSSSATITTSLIAGGDNESYTCTYDFYYELTGSTYTPSTTSLNEYTIKIYDNSSSSYVYSEHQVPSANTTLVSGQSLTSSGTTVSKTYTVTATIYNLNIPQSIYNNSYTSTVSVRNVSCSED